MQKIAQQTYTVVKAASTKIYKLVTGPEVATCGTEFNIFLIYHLKLHDLTIVTAK